MLISSLITFPGPRAIDVSMCSLLILLNSIYIIITAVTEASKALVKTADVFAWPDLALKESLKYWVIT